MFVTGCDQARCFLRVRFERKFNYGTIEENKVIEVVPMDGQRLKRQRMAAGIPGKMVCVKTRIPRSRLSDIERGYVQPSQVELLQIEQALCDLIAARKKVEAVAEKVGYPL